MTTVWGYGSIDQPGTVADGGTFNYPSFTIEAVAGSAIKVKWINDLRDPMAGNHLPHLLPVDQTLHWANPRRLCADGSRTTDCRGFIPGAYEGPVPLVTHVHGAHVGPESENPALDATETWEIYNFTADAHPIHIHLVQFDVVDRQPLVTDAEGLGLPAATFAGAPRLPELWETGRKDTVVAYPGEVTRVKARYDVPGDFVWHCHIVSHEDNEMMRPYRIGP